MHTILVLAILPRPLRTSINPSPSSGLDKAGSCDNDCITIVWWGTKCHLYLFQNSGIYGPWQALVLEIFVDETRGMQSLQHLRNMNDFRQNGFATLRLLAVLDLYNTHLVCMRPPFAVPELPTAKMPVDGVHCFACIDQ